MKELTKRKRLGYASGIVSESVMYNMFFTYFTVFLTDVAHLAPLVAGMVGMISVIWDGVTDPLIGHMADKKGRDKRKFILFAIVPMAVLFVLAFALFDLQSGAKAVYYTAMAMMFWVAYTAYTIPYYALCAQLTDDYDERTRIRGMSSMINAGAIFVGAATPELLGPALVEAGFSEGFGWLMSAAFVAMVAIVFAVITYRSIKDVRLIEDTDASSTNIFKSYLDILKIKPFKFLLAFVFLFMASNALAQANFIYLIEHRMKMSGDLITVALISIVVGMGVFTPLTTWLSTKKDRRFAVIVMLSASAAGMFAFKFIGITTIPALVIMLLFFSMGTAGFWTTFYSFTYDIAEFDELKNGKRRVGAITSLPQLLQKTGAALGLFTIGTVLAFYGYNADLPEQTLSTAIGIENIITLICPALIILSMLVMVAYPVTKQRFEQVKKALEEKKTTGKYDDAGLKKIL